MGKYLLAGAVLFLAAAVVPAPLPAGPLDPAAAEAEVRYSRGLAAFNRQDYGVAATDFRAAVAAEPRNARYHYMTGVAENRQRNYQSAIPSLEEALALQPALPGLHFDLGVAYFGLRRYREALTHLETARAEDPERAAVHFYLGLSHEALGNDAEALTELQRAAALDPGYQEEARMFSGRIYLRQGVTDRAREEFQAASASRDEMVVRLSRDYLGRIEEKRYGPPRRWGYYAYAAGEYDSNVVLNPNDPNVDFPISDESDYRAVVYGRGTFRPYIGPRANVGINYQFYQSLHQDLDEYDLQAHLPSVSFAYTRGRWRFEAEATGAYYFLESDVSYLRRGDVRVEGSVGEGQWGRTGGHFLWRSDHYFDVEDRSGHADIVGLEQFFFPFENKNRYFQAYGLWEDHRAGNDYAYEGLAGGVNFYTPLGKKWDILAGIFYVDYDYENVDSYFGVRREDEEWNYVVRATFDMNRWLSLFMQGLMRDHGSNIGYFEYDRTIWTVGILSSR